MEQINDVVKYTEVKKSILSTTEIIKESFKNAFQKQDENGYVIIKNNRRDEESVLVSLKEYTRLIRKIETMEDERIDSWASKLDPEDYDFVEAKDLDL